MNPNANQIVAKELSDALARCKQKGVDEASVRTGLLTITIANFVNRLGMQNTVSLFQAIPQQFSSGIFDKYIDPNTNTAPVAPPPAMPTVAQGQSYNHATLPQNFVPPNATPTPHHYSVSDPVQQSFTPSYAGYPPQKRRLSE
ncbi:hypothetical protein GUA87_10180 [Sneathiella sp. P13V-1]|uniref:hypothetical protein n=1 Tax=Sneathiella sp. P13V-1 TaxID=2697366 RepID=UPI00187B947F|nr:hypothetical protein [Sneathiella sp. P13V-1]MBE7637211.1 hypothetical protein [Sneathiella sp. P13V-1]